MTTMKEGTGSDPFAEDDEGQEEKSQEPDQVATEAESSDPSSEEEPETTTSENEAQFPYVIRRQRVKDERNNELVAFARDEYAEMEDDVHEAVAEELGMREKKVSLLDLREAFIQHAHNDPEAVAAILEDWGYEHLK
jgi:hypothetical protein